jgi:hypothetical protein
MKIINTKYIVKAAGTYNYSWALKGQFSCTYITFVGRDSCHSDWLHA